MISREVAIEQILDFLLARDEDGLRRFLKDHHEDVSDFINAPDETGTTPLLAAIDVGMLPCVALLLESGAGVNHLSEQVTYTPLHRAVRENRLDVAKLLLESGGDPEACWPEHSSARYRAEVYKQNSFLELFARSKQA